MMAISGRQFLEEGPEVAGVAAINLNPGRLTLVFGQSRESQLEFASHRLKKSQFHLIRCLSF
jgi:hypothetical protein